MASNAELSRLAHQWAVRVSTTQDALELTRQPEFEALLTAVKQSDARFAFEREGRPEAIAAVREALPAMERDLFDAVIDDHACEVAALNEILQVVAQALLRVQRV